MADIFSKAKRPRLMGAIRGKNAKSTELRIRTLFKQARINGWRRNVGGLPGSPDFVFRDARLAIFVDGCFWHSCGRCTRNLRPASNGTFWADKFRKNKLRDQRVRRYLNKQGWSVLRIWEHEIKRT